MKYSIALPLAATAAAAAAAVVAGPAAATPLTGPAFITSFCADVLPVLQGNAKDLLAASDLTGLDEPTQAVINATTQIFAIGTSPEIQQECATGGASNATAAAGQRMRVRRLAANATSDDKASADDDKKKKKTGGALSKIEAGAGGLIEKLEGLFCKMKGSFCTDPATINGAVQPANFKPSITTLVTVGLASMNKTAPSAHVLTLVGDVICGLVPAVAKCDAAGK